MVTEVLERLEAPKLFTTLKNYSIRQFFSDGVAGIVVGIIAIPLGIAFAIASGVSPEKGLFTAIVAGFLISALGGSRVQIGGPTGAFIIIVYGIVQKFGMDGLVVATFMAGFILILMGLARLGTVVKFIPHSVVVGFTSGIALVIFSSEVKDFLGLSMEAVPAGYIEKWRMIIEVLPTANNYSVAIAVFTLIVVALWPRVSRKVPGALIAILITSAAVHFFGWPVETVGTRFGDLPHTLPAPHFPRLDFQIIQHLIEPAVTIALLGAIESLLSCVVSDGMIGGRHRSNVELVAQGIANIGSAAVGGIPATGAIARTITNVRTGGRTPVAGIVHAITILFVMVFFGRWIKHVPLACLAGVLVMVSYHMSEWRSFRDLLKGSRGGALVLLSTFFLTVFVDLTAAIEIGMVLSAFLFMKRMADLTNVKVLDGSSDEDLSAPFTAPEGVEIYEVNGPLFFGAAHKFEEASRTVSKKPKVRILRLRNVPLIDSTGLYALRGFHQRCHQSGIHFFIAGLHAQPLNELVKANLFDTIGEENVFPHIREALDHAERIMKP